MAHNARKEDYQRLGLRFVHELDRGDPLAATRAFAGFGQRFAQDYDSLPQTDADRAFHLVALATDVVDYQLPFATGEQADRLIERGKNLLDEALALDADCFDALRMRSSTEMPTVTARLEYLKAEEPRVREACESARDAAAEDDPERAALAAGIAMRPYHRWLATLAEEALIAGRNRMSVDVCRRLLESDPADLSDARFTLAYGLAKLEDESGLEEHLRRYRSYASGRPGLDAWMGIALLAMAHKRFDLGRARTLLERLLESYPTGAVALIRQNELPDGEFARLYVQPFSEDEMVVALSEAVVLLQEGNDRSGRGVLGAWVAENTARMRPRALAEARALDSRDARLAQGQAPGEASGGGAPGGGALGKDGR